MINNTESKKVYEVQSGVTEYPIGFPFHFNADQTPQLSVVIGHDVLQLNYNCKLSEDKGTLILIPTEEEAEKLTGPDDYSWMDKWVGAHLVIERDIPFVQESDYQLGRISAEQIEHDFDASVMRDQMLADKIGEHTADVQGEIDALHSRIDFVQEEHLLDMANVNASLATKATKTELENARVVLSQGIEAQAQAIQKTRDDYQAADQSIRADMNAKDSELETILNDHAERLNTLRTDHDDLGDDVSDIQAKIPQSASGSNPLVTKQQLLDEEMDIREDVNSGLSEVQTQITAQAAAIAKKAEKDSVYTKEQVDAKVSSVYKVKGSVANYDSLPSNANIGDVYDTLDSGANYVWTENGWDKLGDIVDLTDYAKKEELDEYLPLSGGTVVGPLTVERPADSSYSINQLTLKNTESDGKEYTWSFNGSGWSFSIEHSEIGRFLSFTNLGVFPGGGSMFLGRPYDVWGRVYTKKLNATDTDDGLLTVPTEGGTLARVEDIDAAVGDISTALAAILGE